MTSPEPAPGLSAERSLLLATTNPGKRAEFHRLLPAGIHVLSLQDLPVTLPPEDGTTFAEIAARKALAAATQTGILAIADDSGLEVDALHGAPGVRSARYAGEPASDRRNRAALLAALCSVPDERRTARFRCAVALARPSGVVATAEGTCEGMIGHTEVGEGGFGYDPIFVLLNGRTMAQLSPDEKNRTSHRGHAYRALLPALRRELGLAGQSDELTVEGR